MAFTRFVYFLRCTRLGFVLCTYDFTSFRIDRPRTVRELSRITNVRSILMNPTLTNHKTQIHVWYVNCSVSYWFNVINKTTLHFELKISKKKNCQIIHQKPKNSVFFVFYSMINESYNEVLQIYKKVSLNSHAATSYLHKKKQFQSIPIQNYLRTYTNYIRYLTRYSIIKKMIIKFNIFCMPLKL